MYEQEKLRDELMQERRARAGASDKLSTEGGRGKLADKGVQTLASGGKTMRVAGKKGSEQQSAKAGVKGSDDRDGGEGSR